MVEKRLIFSLPVSDALAQRVIAAARKRDISTRQFIMKALEAAT